MTQFWLFTKKMFRRRATVVWAFIFAMVSAGGLGVGLVMLGPMLNMLLEDGNNLQGLARDFNTAGHWITIPDPLIERPNRHREP